MIVNESSLRSLFTGFKTAFSQAFDGTPNTYQTIAMEAPSGTSEENYGWLGQFSRMRQWVGDRVIRNLMVHTYVIKNLDFEDTIAVPRNSIADDRIGVFKPLISEMGRNAKQHPDQMVYSLLASGFNRACYDGQYFFDSDHIGYDSEGKEISVSNVQAGSGAPWFLVDSSRAIKPIIWQTREPYRFTSVTDPSDSHVFLKNEYMYGVHARVNAGFGLWQLIFGSKAELNVENYGLARAAMAALNGENGRPLGIRPTHLVVGSSLEGTARKLVVNQTRVDNVSGAPVSVANEWAGTADLIITPYL